MAMLCIGVLPRVYTTRVCYMSIGVSPTGPQLRVCVVQMHTSVSLLYTCETRLYVYVSLWAAALSGWP